MSKLPPCVGGPGTRPDSPLWALNLNQTTGPNFKQPPGCAAEESAPVTNRRPQMPRKCRAVAALGKMRGDPNRLPKPKTGLRRGGLKPTAHADCTDHEQAPEPFWGDQLSHENRVEEARADAKCLRIRKLRPRLVFNFVLGSRRSFAVQDETDKGNNHFSARPTTDFLSRPLHFESRFESGNLQRAVQVDELTYELHVQHDSNTNGNTQWYYFSVKNGLPGNKYTFRIVNFRKKDSLYNYGMRPVALSMHQLETKGRGWHRACDNIVYYPDELSPTGSRLHTLQFTFQFRVADDTCYFAHCYPYTFSRLQRTLAILEDAQSMEGMRRHWRRDTLCKSLAGNPIDVIWISQDLRQRSAKELRQRKVVFISARVHPGETVASFVVQGVLQWLCSDHSDALAMRTLYQWCIIPMLNPDGVINGNYRTGLLGVDLNRQWAFPAENKTPSIHHLKNLIASHTGHIEAFIDLHGHSRKCGYFLYGCSDSSMSVDEFSEARLLSHILSQQSSDFDSSSCRWNLSRGKRSTARVVMRNELKLINSYTLEVSFLGSKNSSHPAHFNPSDLVCETDPLQNLAGLMTLVAEEIGHELCNAMHARGVDSCSWLYQMLGVPTDTLPDAVATKGRRRLKKTKRRRKKDQPKSESLEEGTEAQLAAAAAAAAEFMATNQAEVTEEEDSGGSDSDPEGDELEEGAELLIQPQKACGEPLSVNTAIKSRLKVSEGKSPLQAAVHVIERPQWNEGRHARLSQISPQDESNQFALQRRQVQAMAAGPAKAAAEGVLAARYPVLMRIPSSFKVDMQPLGQVGSGPLGQLGVESRQLVGESRVQSLVQNTRAQARSMMAMASHGARTYPALNLSRANSGAAPHMRLPQRERNRGSASSWQVESELSPPGGVLERSRSCVPQQPSCSWNEEGPRTFDLVHSKSQMEAAEQFSSWAQEMAPRSGRRSHLVRSISLDSTPVRAPISTLSQSLSTLSQSADVHALSGWSSIDDLDYMDDPVERPPTLRL